MPDGDIRDLTLRVRVDGKQLKTLGTDFKNVGGSAKAAGKQGQSAGERIRRAFKNLPTAVAAAGILAAYKAFQLLVDAVRNFGSALFRAARQAEDFRVRIGAAFGTTAEKTRELFEAVERFATPLPQTTEEITQAFTRLASVGIAATEERLKALIGTSLATGRQLGDVVYDQSISLKNELLRARLAVPYEGQAKSDIAELHEANFKWLEEEGKI